MQTKSPDVETPGLLVKALISSYFEIANAWHLLSDFFCDYKYN
jgi:hypothetical protein